MAEYIEREALLKLLEVEERFGYLDAGDVHSIPAADVVEVKHGRWIHRKKWDKWVCSECSSEEDRPRKHCPECGVRMDGE